jgi:hypothetical protein
MRKFFAAAIIVGATFGVAIAQTNPTDDAPNMGVAPKVINGPGRADVRVFDQDGHPIQNAKVKLESNRSDGFFCETDWGLTNAKGIMVLPPLHMGEVTLKVKANGYQSQVLHIENSSLAQPIRVNMVRK